VRKVRQRGAAVSLAVLLCTVTHLLIRSAICTCIYTCAPGNMRTEVPEILCA
jgi:hypothetical protein